jgi:tetratricopeptide (TPR) repeat protein
MAPRKIVRSLKRLRETLPSEVPLSGLRITAVGNEIAVQDGDSQRHVESGQMLFDFDVQPSGGGSISFLAKEESPADAAEDWFRRGSTLESESKAKAEAAYRRAISLAPDYVDPWLNLGVMMCDAGRCQEAVDLYLDALRRNPGVALLHFNLAVVLDDLERSAEALASYETCLQLAPRMADAHYNVARLHELSGRRSQAIRHYSEYRRLQR